MRVYCCQDPPLRKEVIKMANKAKPSPDLLAGWMVRLTAATEELQEARTTSALAEKQLRLMIREAFDDGLAAPMIAEATGLTISRLYQIKRGVRH
jgi:hypothetical protein